MIKQWIGKFGAIVALMIVLSLGISESANAYGGSWGSSRGGFGSGGGSWGGGGLLAGRRPLQNLLGIVGTSVGIVGDGIGRIGSRIANVGGAGSIGGAGSGGGLGFAGSRGGLLGGGALRNRLFGGGLLGGGSTGGWGSPSSFAIGGGSVGSLAIGGGPASIAGGDTGYLSNSGHSSWSSGLPYDSAYSYGSTGGLTGGLYSGAAAENYYGDWGSSYLSDASDLSYPIGAFESSFPVATYDSGFSYDAGLPHDSGLSYDSGLVFGSIEDAYTSPISSLELPMYDSGSLYDSGSTYDSSSMYNSGSMIGSTLESYGVSGAIETGYDAPVLDYGASDVYDSSFGNSSQPQPGTIYGPVDHGVAPGAEPSFGDGLPDAPIPDADAGSTEFRNGNSKAILSLKLPREAKVYINGKLTKTQGTLRQYVSRNLSKGKNYRYRVKAVVEKDGREFVRTQLVSMRPGQDRLVRFKFDQPQVTTLVLKVPADAEVLLDGQKTKAKGKIRTFSTRKLTNEQSWNDYKIEVRYLKDGKQVTEQRTLNLVAGAKKMIAIGGSSNDSDRKANYAAIARK